MINLLQSKCPSFTCKHSTLFQIASNLLLRCNLKIKSKRYTKPLSHQTAMPQCLYSVLKTCQRAVGSLRNTPKISNFVIACTRRPHSVHTVYTRRSHSVFIASMTLLPRTRSYCSVFTARSRRT